jgi:hypothetical protein
MAANAPREQRTEVYKAFLRMIDEGLGDSGKMTLEAQGDRVLPRLVQPEMFEGQPEAQDLVRVELADLGLCLTYVLDSEFSVQYLGEETVEQLGLDRAALHELAMKNLRRMSCIGEVIRRLSQEPALMTVKTMDSHDATRILLVPECLDADQQIVALIPDRDTLTLALPPKDGDWRPFEKLAKIPDSDRLLIDRPVLVTKDGFTVK